jgi:hypothetical protein
VPQLINEWVLGYLNRALEVGGVKLAAAVWAVFGGIHLAQTKRSFADWERLMLDIAVLGVAVGMLMLTYMAVFGLRKHRAKS